MRETECEICRGDCGAGVGRAARAIHTLIYRESLAVAIRRRRSRKQAIACDSPMKSGEEMTGAVPLGMQHQSAYS